MVDTVRTEDDLLDNLFQDGQPDDSITANHVRDFVVSSKYLNLHGWDFHLDGTYVTGSRRTILAGARTQITIDGTGEDIGHPVETHTADHFWNVSTNQIVPSAANDFGIVRFAMTGSSIAASTNRFEVELDVGGSTGVIFQETGVFAKGSGADQWFNFTIPLFAGPDFVANGGTIFVTPESDADFWDFALTAVRVYAAMP